MEALRWALRAVSFEVVLKVDDDSIVHVGRLWVWIFQEMHLDDPDATPPTRLYAGRVFRNSQVIRRNFTRKDLWHPGWFPGSFQSGPSTHRSSLRQRIRHTVAVVAMCLEPRLQVVSSSSTTQSSLEGSQ